MGGRVLEYKGERVYNKGKTDGRTEGAIETLVSLIHGGLLDEDVAIERASQDYGITAADFKKMLKGSEPDPDTEMKEE